MRNLKNIISVVLTVLFVFLIGCQGTPPVVNNKVLKPNKISVPEKSKVSENIPKAVEKKQITPYTGPINIKIDTSLNSPYLEKLGYKKSGPFKTYSLNSTPKNTFNIKSAPSGTILFGPESFTRTGGAPDNFIRNFNVTDLNRRFVIFLQNTGGASASVLLNGTQVIFQSDLNNQVTEVQREVSLNASNSLDITINGSPGDTIELSFFDIGPKIIPDDGYSKKRAIPPGHLRNRNADKGLMEQHPTQNQHLYANDSVGYDSTIDSLNGLKPSEASDGDINRNFH